MTVKQACKRLEISASKLYQLVALRRIAHYRIGGKIVFHEEDVATFLTGCRVGAAAPGLAAARPPRFKLKHIRLNHGS